MKKRDIVVLVVCCLGILFLTMYDGGAISLHRGFHERLEDGAHHEHGQRQRQHYHSDNTARYRDENVPRPVVIDLDGDGNKGTQ